MANRPPARRSRIQTEKNAIGCHELRAKRKCSREGTSNCEQMGLARRKARSIMSKRELLERRGDQSRAKGKCWKEGGTNYEQKRNARKRARSITSKKEMLKGRRVQLRANGKCSKEGPPNCEQKEFARRRTRPIAILNIGGCGYAPIGGSIRIIARAASIAWRGS